MKHEVRLQEFLSGQNPHRRAKASQAFEEPPMIGRLYRDKKIQIFGESWLGMKANRHSTDDEIFNLAGVECLQQIGPIF